MSGLYSVAYQFLRPSKPRFVEKDVPDLTGKVNTPSSRAVIYTMAYG